MRRMKQLKEAKNNGFTLIELLVVIAIIGLLASIAVVSLNSARVKSRNAKRNADIKQMITAFTMASDVAGGELPSSGGENTWACVSAACFGGWSVYSANAVVDAALAPFVKKTEDPAETGRGFGGYLYSESWTGGTGYGGVVFPVGPYLAYMLEPVSISAGVCGQAQIWGVTANYIQCMIKIN